MPRRNTALPLHGNLVGSRQLDLGQLEPAVEAYDKSLAINGDLLALEPDNTDWQTTRAGGLLQQAENEFYAGRTSRARTLLKRARGYLARMMATDPTNQNWSQDFRSNALRMEMLLALSDGDMANARRHSEKALALVEDARDDSLPNLTRLLLTAGDVAQQSGQQQAARNLWQKAFEAMDKEGPVTSTKFRLTKRLGRAAEAAELAQELDRRGHRHPAYVLER